MLFKFRVFFLFRCCVDAGRTLAPSQTLTRSYFVIIFNMSAVFFRLSFPTLLFPLQWANQIHENELLYMYIYIYNRQRACTSGIFGQKNSCFDEWECVFILHSSVIDSQMNSFPIPEHFVIQTIFFFVLLLMRSNNKI